MSMAYNRANGNFALWTMAVRHDGVARAHAEHRTDLHAARDAYAIAGADEDLDEQMRCKRSSTSATPSTTAAATPTR